jgi:hypothetical protein
MDYHDHVIIEDRQPENEDTLAESLVSRVVRLFKA